MINVKKYLYRAYLFLLLIAGLYAVVGIGNFQWMYYRLYNPAAFQVTGDVKSNITVIEFMNYTCPYCKKLNPTIQELLAIKKDIRFIARPLAFDEGPSNKLTRVAIAAGLQGKFWEMHHALLENPDDVIEDSFIEETALLYDINYEQLQKDMNSKKVDKIIKENLDAMSHAGITGTPSIFVGKTIYMAGKELPTLAQLLDVIAKEEK